MLFIFLQKCLFWLFDMLVRMDCKVTAGKTAKEKKMAKKNFLLGMLVMALVFGMTVIGCEAEDEFYPAELKVTNSSTAEITLVEFRTSSNAVVQSDRTGISAGNSKTYTFDSDFTGSAKVELTVASLIPVEVTISNLVLNTGYYKDHSTSPPSKKELLVSGSTPNFELTIK
jgi:hypothetical protein